MTTITDNQRHFTEALMLAIVAPDDEKYEKAMGLASQFAETLSEKDIEYSKMGIEVCMDYLKRF
jgi:rRNA maturation endonuclease Nob1